MKSADEIIIKKEWQELSPGERDMIADLAQSESEYNLLKKILQVSASETAEVPIMRDIYPAIRQQIFKAKSTKNTWYGVMAAASVIAVIISIFLFTKNEKANDIVKENIGKPVESFRKDTLHQTPKEQPLVVNPVDKQPDNKTSPSPAPPSRILPVVQPDSLSFAAVSVADEPQLLDLIAEAE
jgi:hypothetical protein